MSSMLLVAALSLLAAAPVPAAETFGAPGQTAVLQVELRAGAGVLFNHRGPSRLRLSSPLGPPAELRVARGTPLASDPDNYDTTVPPLRFEIPVPADARPGDYALELTGELYLCDEARHACYRTRRSATATLHVGSEGRDAPLVLELPGEALRNHGL